MDIIEIRNTSDSQPLVLNGNDRIVIEPGGKRIVPFVLACAFFGDPRLQDAGRDRQRTDNYRNVRFMWGYSEGLEGASWDEIRPQFECYDVNSGERVYMVLDDPTGTAGNVVELGNVVDHQTQDAEQLTNQIRTLERQVAGLVQRIAEMGQPVPTISTDPFTEDVGAVPTAVAAAAQQAVTGTVVQPPVEVDEAATVEDGITLPQPPADDDVSSDEPTTVRISNADDER